MTHMAGRSLELYFIEGKPDGMLVAEVFNWTGHILKTPRTRLSAALQRPESEYTGVYVLLGEKDGKPYAYIGESEEIASRIKNHDTKKEWWTSAVFITTAANVLNKAHVKYLEARLVELAKEAGNVTLENGNAPPRPSLSESAVANMEAFLAYLVMVFPAIRVDIFLKNTVSASAVAASGSSAAFELETPKHGLKATAVIIDGDFVVEQGSIARAGWMGVGSADSGYANLHKDLVAKGILKVTGDHALFTQNYSFDSPSAAAAVVNGRPANGTLEWKQKGTGKTYKEWEAAQLSQSAGTAA